MGFFDSLFKGKKSTVTAEPMQPQWQQDLGKQAGDWAKKYMDQYTPGEAYEGQFTAGKTPYESEGLNMLTRLMSSGLGDLYGAGKNELMKTLSGEYADPTKSKYLQSMEAIGKRNLRDEIDATRARRGARGTYFHSKGIEEEGDLSSRMLENLNALMGGFMETERGRQFQAAPMAADMGKYENMDMPLQKIQASQTLGALDRILEQSNLEAKYQDWMRARGETKEPLSVAQQLYSTQVPYDVKNFTSTAPSTFSSIMDVAGKLAPMIPGFTLPGFGSGGMLSKMFGIQQ